MGAEGRTIEGELEEIIRMLKPAEVYLPAPYERHKTHQVCTRITIDALRAAEHWPSMALGYSLWGSFWGGKERISRDIGPVIRQKVDAVIAHASQIEYKSYHQGILGKNNYEAVFLESHEVQKASFVEIFLDLTELLKRGNGLFGSAEQTGSLGVVTINCARLGHLYAGDEEALYARLDHLLELARTSLELKRKVIQHHIDGGLFPYTKRYLGTLRNHFSTVGVNGINEMIRNFTRDAADITTARGHAFAVRLDGDLRELGIVNLCDFDLRFIGLRQCTGRSYKRYGEQ